mgnify:CR=1 FL=1
MKSKSTDTLASVKEVADVCKCSVATVWRRAADKTFPQPIKIGGMTRWSMSELNQFIEVAKAERTAS